MKAIPIGGYVQIAGMNPFDDVPPGDEPRRTARSPIWQRALVIFAGPGARISWSPAFLFAICLAIVGDPTHGPLAPLLSTWSRSR